MGGPGDTEPARATMVDEPLDSATAMIYSPKAPLASSAADVREDARAVWAHLSTGFDVDKPSVLMYYHGHNNHVLMTLNARTQVAETKIPSWVPTHRRGQAGVRASGPKYELDKLTAGTFHPLVLVPEVGSPVLTSAADLAENARQREVNKPVEDANAKKPKGEPKDPLPFPKVPSATADSFWGTEGASAPKLGTATGIEDLVDNCAARLRVLPVIGKTSVNYLTKDVSHTKITRLFIGGHSGGGVPLSSSAKSNLPQTIPTDLILLDCNYDQDFSGYTAYLRAKAGASKLGTATGQSRFICVNFTDSGTKGNAKKLFDTVKADATLAKAVAGSGAPVVVNIADTKPQGADTATNINRATSPSSAWPTADIAFFTHAGPKFPTGTKTNPVVSPAQIATWRTQATTNLAPFEEMIKKYAIVFILTSTVPHDEVPTIFFPLVVKTAL
jgi:hypothetical protein